MTDLEKLPDAPWIRSGDMRKSEKPIGRVFTEAVPTVEQTLWHRIIRRIRANPFSTDDGTIYLKGWKWPDGTIEITEEGFIDEDFELND